MATKKIAKTPKMHMGGTLGGVSGFDNKGKKQSPKGSKMVTMKKGGKTKC